MKLYAKKNWVIAITVLLLGCKKDTTTQYTLGGYLYRDCSMQPIANTEVKFHQGNSTNLLLQVTNGTVATTTTDANGYFKISYIPINDAGISILEKAGAGFSAIVEAIPPKKNINDIKGYIDPRVNVKVYLNVINPHAAGDTLVIQNLGGSALLKVPCPLQSGLLYTASNKFLFGSNEYRGANVNLSYYFTPYNGTKTNNYFLIDKFCSDTVKLVVDIR